MTIAFRPEPHRRLMSLSSLWWRVLRKRELTSVTISQSRTSLPFDVSVFSVADDVEKARVDFRDYCI